jgi:hypothetical protein
MFDILVNRENTYLFLMSATPIKNDAYEIN